MTYIEQRAFDVAKEITIAKLSKSSPNNSNKEVGELIGEMFQAIYLKVLETAKGSHQDTKAE